MEKNQTPPPTNIIINAKSRTKKTSLKKLDMFKNKRFCFNPTPHSNQELLARFFCFFFFFFPKKKSFSISHHAPPPPLNSSYRSQSYDTVLNYHHNKLHVLAVFFFFFFFFLMVGRAGNGRTGGRGFGNIPEQNSGNRIKWGYFCFRL